MAKHKVLKSFPFAKDGLNTEDTVVDEEIEVSAAHAPGLIAAGYIANAAVAETASKIAGETLAAGDHAGTVDSELAVHQEMNDAKARISDGKIGEPEARAIVDAHKLEPLPAAALVQAALDEKAAHEVGDTDFDPQAPAAVAAAQAKIDGEDDADPVPAKSAKKRAAK